MIQHYQEWHVFSKLYIENSCTVKWVLNIMLRKSSVRNFDICCYSVICIVLYVCVIILFVMD